ncbi:MAG: ABC transporter permease [Thaumarchaeota archaeon]|nr:ABC transporter permease [Nitrososphaerota archaeon]
MASTNPPSAMVPVPATKGYTVLGRKVPRSVYRFFRNKLAVIGMTIVLINCFVAIFAQFIAPYNPDAIPLTIDAFQNPSWTHLLGTDELGRDMFSRIVFGTQISLTVGLFSVLLSGTVGITLGTVAGWMKGKVDRVLEAIFDIWLSLPSLILSIILVTFLGAGVRNVILAVAVSNIPSYARLIRAEVIRLSDKDFIVAQRLLGFSSWKIVVKNVLPNAATPIIVYSTFSFAVAILAEASLSFLGLGVLPPTPSWGAILNELQVTIFAHIEPTFWPGLAIMQLVLGFNFLGDGLRDAFDPRLKV